MKNRNSRSFQRTSRWPGDRLGKFPRRSSVNSLTSSVGSYGGGLECRCSGPSDAGRASARSILPSIVRPLKD